MNERFEQKLGDYKGLIDTRIVSVADEFRVEATADYNGDLAVPIDAFIQQYLADGKRIRGALTLAGYGLYGGEDTEMAIDAACAVEMFHSYILTFDDMQDNADSRRDTPTVHKIIEKSKIRASTEEETEDLIKIGPETARSLAFNAGLSANHYAQLMILRLNVPEQRKNRVLQLMNRTMIITAGGQTDEILLAHKAAVDNKTIEDVMQRKTAEYTIMNPLQVGMILAGASEKELAVVEKYSRHVGRAFQITDDALPYISKASGKDNKSDIKEGKITLIMFYALEATSKKDAEFLRSCLGNMNLSNVDFKKCVKIAHKSGAVEKALASARASVAEALLDAKSLPNSWQRYEKSFLTQLAQYILDRKK